MIEVDPLVTGSFPQALLAFHANQLLLLPGLLLVLIAAVTALTVWKWWPRNPLGSRVGLITLTVVLLGVGIVLLVIALQELAYGLGLL